MAQGRLREILGLNIRTYLKRLNYTQEKAAELAGISNGYLSDLLSGAKWPSDKVLERLAEVLQVEPTELFVPPGSPLGVQLERLHRIEMELREKVQDLIKASFQSYLAEQAGGFEDQERPSPSVRG